mmetsp:Transcript_82669/g.221651  ORF Transcript_82669/g.221651 Transcript_82669/m.221651 type:complete len:535 (-) Transcript_82669:643-2247(-)
MRKSTRSATPVSAIASPESCALRLHIAASAALSAQICSVTACRNSKMKTQGRSNQGRAGSMPTRMPKMDRRGSVCPCTSTARTSLATCILVSPAPPYMSTMTMRVARMMLRRGPGPRSELPRCRSAVNLCTSARVTMRHAAAGSIGSTWPLSLPTCRCRKPSSRMRRSSSCSRASVDLRASTKLTNTCLCSRNMPASLDVRPVSARTASSGSVVQLDTRSLRLYLPSCSPFLNTSYSGLGSVPSVAFLNISTCSLNLTLSVTIFSRSYHDATLSSSSRGGQSKTSATEASHDSECSRIASSAFLARSRRPAALSAPRSEGRSESRHFRFSTRLRSASTWSGSDQLATTSLGVICSRAVSEWCARSKSLDRWSATTEAERSCFSSWSHFSMSTRVLARISCTEASSAAMRRSLSASLSSASSASRSRSSPAWFWIESTRSLRSSTSCCSRSSRSVASSSCALRSATSCGSARPLSPSGSRSTARSSARSRSTPRHSCISGNTSSWLRGRAVASHLRSPWGLMLLPARTLSRLKSR